MLFGSLVMLAFFPAYLSAQNIQLPTVEIRAGQELVPQAVKEAVIKDFGESHKPFAWVNNESTFDASQWEQSTNVLNLDIFNYTLSTRTSNGSSLDAVYSPDGKLITSREYLKNFKPDLHIMLALQGTAYKDWSLSKDYLVKRVSSNGSEKERITLVMQKGNSKKTVQFDNSGKMIAALDGEHAELADANW